MTLQHKFKSHSGFDQFKQAEKQRIAALQDRLVSEAESKVITYFIQKYGSTKLDRESKPQLSFRKGTQDQVVADGVITVHAQISAGPAARKLSMDVRVVHSTLGLPKYKFIDKLVADTKTEGQLKEVLTENQVLPSTDVYAKLDAFKIIDKENQNLEVFHPLYGETSLGKLSRLEYDQSDKNALVHVGFECTFNKDHSQKILAGKPFKVVDVDGDMVQLEVGGVRGWIDTGKLHLESSKNSILPVKKEIISLGDRVLITSALMDYYGDTITASDLINKEATVARLSDGLIILRVDNIAEEVVISKEHLVALHLLEQVAVDRTPVRLESLLRSMLLDKFTDGTRIRFTGKFKAPELVSDVQLSKGISKVAHEEEKQMVPKELELKYKQASGLDQYQSFELQKIAAKKRALSEKVASELVQLLNKSYSPTRIIATSDSLNYEGNKGYSGTVSVEAEVVADTGLKRIVVSIPFVSDQYTMLKEVDLAKLIIASISEQDKQKISFDLEAKEKMAKIDAEEAFNAEQLQTILASPKVEKKAAAFIQPPESSISPILYVSKFFLPESLQVGALVDFGDAKYKLVSKAGNALSKDTDSGSQWAFQRVYESSSESPTYKVTNY